MGLPRHCMSTDGGDRPLVSVLGSGPPIEAVTAALDDVSVRLDRSEDSLETATLAIATAPTEGDGLTRINRRAVDAGTPWIAIEIGGIGASPTDSPGTVSLLSPTGPCYACLRQRIEATTTPPEAAATASRTDSRFAGALAGRMAIRWLSGEESAGTVISVPHSRRRLLALPHCPICGDERSFTLDRSFRETDLEDVAERIEQAVDEQLGPVHRVGERESYPAPYYLAQLTPTKTFSDAAVMDQAAGVAAGWDRAYVKALGEALERYCAGVYRTDAFVTAPERALSDAVSPDAFVLGPQATPPDTTEAMQWVRGTALRNGSEVHLPAERVVFPPPSRRLGAPITTGLGLGSSTVEAILSGLTEVIERDATMCSWYSTFDPVGLTADDAGVSDLSRRARGEDLSVTLTLLTQDIDVPVVSAAVSRKAWPRFAAGSAADLDADTAARNALGEALQNWMELRALGPEQADEAGQAVAAYANDPSRVSELIDQEPVLAASDVGPENPPTSEAALGYLLEQIESAGLSAYGARLTTRDVHTLGFEAVRVLVPGAQPLFVDEPCFGDRVTTVPPSLGYEPALDRGFHPYP